METKLTVDNSELSIRPLNSRSIRVVISNVQLCIQNSVIENELRKLNIKTVSIIQQVKSGVHKPRYSHWISFRKQVIINPESEKTILPSLQISYDGVRYNIHLFLVQIKCVICTQEGHMAKYCREQNSDSNQTDEIDASV